jgi:hypothetical protein
MSLYRNQFSVSVGPSIFAETLPEGSPCWLGTNEEPDGAHRARHASARASVARECRDRDHLGAASAMTPF